MDKRALIKAIAALPLAASGLNATAQQAPFKIGFITPLTGPFASTGKQMEAGVRLYMAQNGMTVAGRKIELIVKDDAGTPDQTKRIAQELLVNDKVDVLAGFGLTPLALAAAPLAMQSNRSMVGTTKIRSFAASMAWPILVSKLLCLRIIDSPVGQ